MSELSNDYRTNVAKNYDSFYGTVCIQKKGEDYIVLEGENNSHNFLVNSELNGRKIFNEDWIKRYNRIVEKDPNLQYALDELQIKMKNLLEGKTTSLHHKTPWLSDDDEIFYVEDFLNLIERDTDGTAKLIVGSSFNISEAGNIREKIHELSKENIVLHELNSRAIHSAKILVWQMKFAEKDGMEYVYVNDNYCEILGLKYVKPQRILFNDFLRTAFPDEEGIKTFQVMMNGITDIVEGRAEGMFHKVVKHQNLITKEVVYLEHNSTVEERTDTGEIITIGGSIIDRTHIEKINQENKNLVVELNREKKANELALKSGNVMVWFSDAVEDETGQSFYGNDLLFEVLKLKRHPHNKFTLEDFNKSIYLLDDEAREYAEKYHENDQLIVDGLADSYEKVIVKHRPLNSEKILYLEHTFKVEERYPDGKLKVRGGIIKDISKEMYIKKRNDYLIAYDMMTDLLNRNSFEQFTTSELPRKYTLIIADIDGLKFFNDAFGHVQGDFAIKAVANTLKSVFRFTSKIFRIGGDEFAIISSETNDTIIESRIKEVKSLLNLQSNFGSYAITSSMGYEIVLNSEEQDFTEVFIDAENIMYRRKLLERHSRKSKIMETVLETLNQKTEETKEHCNRLENMSVELMNRIGYTRKQDIEDIKLLCQVHDIGKITVAEEILSKPSKLSFTEYEKIRKHSEAGYKIVQNIVDSEKIALGVLHHHERWDGQGYPFGLEGEDIPLFARIIAICDAYDVMKHGRIYSKTKTTKEITEEIYRCSGTQFDPNISSKFIELLLEQDEENQSN